MNLTLSTTIQTTNTFVSTIAGRSFYNRFANSLGLVGGFADDNATNALFESPYGVAVDSSGNIFVADTKNHKIRKITKEGIVSTFAGIILSIGDTSGFADGTASNSQFYFPGGLAVDSIGNVYVADTMNNKIRKITKEGIVSTLAGSGGFHEGSGFADGTGSNAQFYHPSGVAVDSIGNVYVADTMNNKIRKITKEGIVSTLAGSGGFHEGSGFADGTGSNAQFYHPSGVAVDSSGNIYVADTFNHRIRKITPTGVVTTLAGSGGFAGFDKGGFADGAGSNAQFNLPYGVAVDNQGNVFVGDRYNNKIRKITLEGFVTTLAGSGSNGFGTGGFADGNGINAQFNEPFGVAVDNSGNVFVADTSNHKIRKIQQYVEHDFKLIDH